MVKVKVLKFDINKR